MITATIPIPGPIHEIRDGFIRVRCGDRMDSYNERYYRPGTAPHEIRRQAPRKDETFANLLELEMRKRTKYPDEVAIPERVMSKRQTATNLLMLARMTKVWHARDVYTGQYLTLMNRWLTREEVTSNDGNVSGDYGSPH